MAEVNAGDLSKKCIEMLGGLARLTRTKREIVNELCNSLRDNRLRRYGLLLGLLFPKIWDRHYGFPHPLRYLNFRVDIWWCCSADIGLIEKENRIHCDEVFPSNCSIVAVPVFTVFLSYCEPKRFMKIMFDEQVDRVRVVKCKREILVDSLSQVV